MAITLIAPLFVLCFPLVSSGASKKSNSSSSSFAFGITTGRPYTVISVGGVFLVGKGRLSTSDCTTLPKGGASLWRLRKHVLCMARRMARKTIRGVLCLDTRHRHFRAHAERNAGFFPRASPETGSRKLRHMTCTSDPPRSVRTNG